MVFIIITKISLKEKELLYIIVALKPEAQAFIDKFKLKKSKLSHFTVFSNEEIKLIVSGMTQERSRAATQVLINHYDIRDEDIYINVGICAADNSYEIGELIEIGTIFYEEIPYSFFSEHRTILCSDVPLSTKSFPLVDMESFGFYDAVIHNPAIKTFHIFKVVSDHFEPDKVTKEGTKMLIFNQINAINKILKK
jgi:hypothetical protein